MKKVLIVGFGSIGQRHFQNFKELGCDISIVSKRMDRPSGNVFLTVENALSEKVFDIVIVCNETALHYGTLVKLAEMKSKSLILVEKPIFDSVQDSLKEIESLNIRVMYNFRYSALLLELKNQLQSNHSLSVMSYVGQYLPTWRPSRDYRTTYSAQKALGGGVVLDLSHEIDYLNWLFGNVLNVTATTGKFGDLDIDVEDCCGFLAKYDRCPMVMSQLNYLDHIKQRFLIVNTAKATFHLDFIKNTFKKNETETSIAKVDTYKALALDALESESSRLTSLEDALKLQKMISHLKEEIL